jgi:hypothetical protein
MGIPGDTGSIAATIRFWLINFLVIRKKCDAGLHSQSSYGHKEATVTIRISRDKPGDSPGASLVDEEVAIEERFDRSAMT